MNAHEREPDDLRIRALMQSHETLHQIILSHHENVMALHHDMLTMKRNVMWLSVEATICVALCMGVIVWALWR